MVVKSPQELKAMRRAGRVVARALAALREAIRPGMRTEELDAIAEAEIRRHGATPSFIGYRGFPASLCVSINEEIVHGIPGDRVVREGDIVSLDVGAIVDGFHGDAAITVGVGRAAPKAQRLIDAAQQALEAGIQAARAGSRLGEISVAIQTVAESRGYSVVREYVGHGIGRNMHEEPAVPNYGRPGRGVLLQEGMALAIEPMLNIGTWKTKVKGDNWTVVTEDGSLSAHFEHTIAITADGAEVLTRL
ncbi:MAG: type I methionyl aminopeptidase [Dehalococcoidia bacterium]